MKDEFEEFKEFICDSNELQENLEEKVLIEQLHIALTNLDKKEKEIIDLLFFKKLTEREVAEIKGISQPMIHRKKQRILKKLKMLCSMDFLILLSCMTLMLMMTVY